MGIAATVAGIGSALGVTSVASGIGLASAGIGLGQTVSGLVGGGGGAAPGTTNNILGTGITAAAQLQGGQIQADAAQKALDEQMPATAAQTNAFQPFLQATPGIQTNFSNLLGAGPQGAAGILPQLQALPGYQFQLGQGEQAVKSQLSSMGLADSGSAIKGASQYAENLAGTYYQNYVSDYSNAVNTDVNAATQFGNIYQNAQNAQNNLNLDIGKAQAAGIVGAGNVVGGGFANQNALNSAVPQQSTNPMDPTAASAAANAAALSGNTNNLYDVNQIAMQNPYQIQAPQINPQINASDINALTPTLATG